MSRRATPARRRRDAADLEVPEVPADQVVRAEAAEVRDVEAEGARDGEDAKAEGARR